MKAIVLTGSRADRNCQEMVHEALLKAGHDSEIFPATAVGLCFVRDRRHYERSVHNAEKKQCVPDVAVLAGDRIEMLESAVHLAAHHIPICHISGGDVTEGSADDRYRDAITALACIHCAETEIAGARLLSDLVHLGEPKDSVYVTGNPALDRIRQTPVLSRQDTFTLAFNNPIRIPEHGMPVALVCVHPNTVGNDPLADWRAVSDAFTAIGDNLRIIAIGANADSGGADINALWRHWNAKNLNVLLGKPDRLTFVENAPPQLYYSLMAHCDVMVGNSSAMLCEAPLFGLPCVLVGDRQKGRPLPECVSNYPANIDAKWLAAMIEQAVKLGRVQCANPYGDGHSAPRVVKALEDNAWRWKKT